MIDILVVDDSPAEALLLTQLFNAEKDMRVVGHAKNGIEAIKLTKQLKPHVITMDILMPDMNGFEATHTIMSQCPTPIVVISSAANDILLNTTFKALNAGALTVLEKLDSSDTLNFNYKKKFLIDTIRSMASVAVIKKRFFTKPKLIAHTKLSIPSKEDIEIIAIGASVGGPSALNTIFADLPSDFPVPIVVVQHMTPGFLEGFAHWLDQRTPLHVKIAKDHDCLQKGYIYFAPDGEHLTVKRTPQGLIAHLVKGPPIGGFCPSITALMQSVAKTSKKHAIGILLTGMGSDGAEGLLELKAAHGHTLAQDADSSVVFGMGGVAASLNAVDKVIPLNKIADYLTQIFAK